MADTIEETAEEKAYFEQQKAPAEAPTETPAAPEAEAPEAEVTEGEQPVTEERKPPAAIPYGAFKAEKDRRKALERDLAKLTGRVETLQSLAQRDGPQQAQEKPIVDDPLGELEKQRQWRQSQEQERRQNQALAELGSIYRSEAEKYAEEQPDFYEAQAHFNTNLVKELRLLGHQPHVAEKMATEIEAAAAQVALRDGVSPAERVYQLAQMRGYAKKAAASNINAEARMAMVEQGQKAAKSLANGKASTAKPTAVESLLSMSDEEFDKATEGKKWKQLLGAAR